MRCEPQTITSLMNATFCDVSPRGLIINRCFGGTCSLHLQSIRNNAVSYRPTLYLARVISPTLKMVMTRSSETSVYDKPTWHRIPEDGILHGHRREDLRFYTKQFVFPHPRNVKNMRFGVLTST
jgi:hypothetical protein